MADLGRKYTCYSCHTKFYDLGKPIPVCPKCGADQRDAEEAPPATSHRGRAARAPVVVEEAPADEEFPAEPEAAATPEGGEDEEEDIVPTPEREEEAEEEEEEEEY